jgi:hypothetical protein
MLTEKSKPDFGFLPFRPRTLISLADMVEFFTAGVAHNWQWLKRERIVFVQKAVEFPAGKPNQMEIHNLNALLKTQNVTLQGNKLPIRGWLYYCNQLGLEKSKARIEHFLMIVNFPTTNFSVVDSELMGIENSLWLELLERQFTFISTDKVRFFEQGKLFGEDVFNAFPDAREEIKAAGNCLASDLNTAAVFHLMRVAEIGLRKAAKLIRVKIKHELNLADWGEILKGIEKKRDVLELKKRTSGNEKNLIFYSSVLSDLKGFKHVWRNRVMHARASYNFNEALGVFGHVKDFMERMAIKVLKTSSPR